MNKKKTYVFLIIGLLSILIMKVDFIKNSYFILTKNFHERFIIAYSKDQFSGFCSKESHGYIKYIKYKFNIKSPPKIINFSNKRTKLPYWIFNRNKKVINNDNIILTNYQFNNDFDFNDYLVKDNFNNQCFFLIKK